MKSRILALALAGTLAVLGMACEQDTADDPLEDDTEEDAGTDTEPTPEATP